MAVNPVTADYRMMTEPIAAMLKDTLGVAVEVQIQEFASFTAAMNRRDALAAFMTGWSGTMLDPNYFLELWLHGKSALNRVNYANPAFDSLLDQANATTDRARRTALVQAGGPARRARGAADPDHVHPLRVPGESPRQGARGRAAEPRVRAVPHRRSSRNARGSETSEEAPPMAIWDDVIPREQRELYERGGWGGRVGFGRRPALVVIDMFTAFVDPAYPFASPGAPECARQIRRLLDEARRARRARLPHAGRADDAAGRAGPVEDRAASTRRSWTRPEAYQLVPEVAALPDEPVIVKAFPSGFVGTNLLAYLVYHNVDTLIVTGTVTSGCVRDTVLDAFNHNYRVIVPVEAVCDRGETSHKVTLFDIHMKYGDVLPLAEVLDYLKTVRSGEASLVLEEAAAR